MASDVEATVRAVVEGYADSKDAGEDLELDSLSLVQLVEDLEEAFDLVVAEKDLDGGHFSSVARIVAFVRRATK